MKKKTAIVDCLIFRVKKSQESSGCNPSEIRHFEGVNQNGADVICPEKNNNHFMRITPILRSKIFIALAAVVVLLIAFRLMLPRIILDYVNRNLNELEDYSGKTGDIDVSLPRGV